MPVRGGGGFALAVGSHRAPWKDEAHRVTGSTKTLPPGGFKDAADMFANRTGSGTCNLKSAAPLVNQQMERVKRVYEIKQGDVIFHDRWLFHRTIPFDRELVQILGGSEVIYRRYSVRYSPGEAVVPPGYGLELSVLSNPENGGRTADQVAEMDGPWYPKCWPSVSEVEMKTLESLVQVRVPIAEALRKSRRQELKPYLRDLGKRYRS